VGLSRPADAQAAVDGLVGLAIAGLGVVGGEQREAGRSGVGDPGGDQGPVAAGVVAGEHEIGPGRDREALADTGVV
jgi:hypothetical protein